MISFFYIYQVPKLYQTTIEAVADASGICVACSFSADSTTEGCVIELQSDDNVFAFKVSHNKDLELKCFSVPEAGVYSVYTYETPLGIHTCSKLSDVTIAKPKGKKYLKKYKANYIII